MKKLKNNELIVGKWYKIIKKNDDRDFWNAVVNLYPNPKYDFTPIYYGTSFLFLEKINNDKFYLKCLYNGKICYIVDSYFITFEESFNL